MAPTSWRGSAAALAFRRRCTAGAALTLQCQPVEGTACAGRCSTARFVGASIPAGTARTDLSITLLFYGSNCAKNLYRFLIKHISCRENVVSTGSTFL